MDFANNSGPLSRGGFNSQNCPDKICAIVHGSNSHAIVADCAGRKATAVIRNYQRNVLSGNGEGNGNGFGASVLQSVVDAFLGNTKKLVCHSGVQNFYG